MKHPVYSYRYAVYFGKPDVLFNVVCGLMNSSQTTGLNQVFIQFYQGPQKTTHLLFAPIRVLINGNYLFEHWSSAVYSRIKKTGMPFSSSIVPDPSMAISAYGVYLVSVYSIACINIKLRFFRFLLIPHTTHNFKIFLMISTHDYLISCEVSRKGRTF